MRRHRRLWSVLLVLAAGSWGCVENRASVSVRQMAIPDSSCTATAGSDDFISMGTLDIGLAGAGEVVEYYMWPEVENNMVPTAEAEGIELNNIEIIEARVELDFGAIGATLDADTAKFRYPAYRLMGPTERAPIRVLGIPAPTARTIANLLPNVGDSVIVRVKLKFLYGHGEYEHETHEVEFPVLVCNFCLLTPLEDAPLCDSGLLPTNLRTGNACNIFQDAPVDCCQSGGQLICPAVDTSEGGGQ